MVCKDTDQDMKHSKVIKMSRKIKSGLSVNELTFITRLWLFYGRKDLDRQHKVTSLKFSV